MGNVLNIFVFLVFIIVITRIFNEKVLKISDNIAILIVSFGISIALLLGIKFNVIDEKFFIFSGLKKLHIDELLLEGTLCFMLFAGSSKLQFSKLVSNLKSITLLSFLTTTLNSIIYGACFYGIAYLLNVKIGFLTCLLLGCIISPTDPIAATSILNKLGLPKGVSSVIEGESLFNDGIAVALFIFIQNLITNANSENFVFLILKNLFGAIIVGLVISYISYKLLKQTKNPNLHILISLLDVSLCYVICEHFGFSGVITCVVCGMYFSYQNKKCERWKNVVDPDNLYTDFWDIVDELLNNSLFVLIGLTAFTIPINKETIILIPIAIIINIVGRYLSVYLTCFILGKKNIPNKYEIKDFTKLMTVTALRGGLSLAMALGTVEILDIDEYNILINMVMITILFTTIIQGMLIPAVYKKIDKNRYGMKEENVEK